MQVEVAVTLNASPELLSALNNLAAAFTVGGVIEKAKAPRASGKKAQPEVAENTGSSGSDSQAVTFPAPSADSNVPTAPTPPVEQSEATASTDPAVTLEQVRAKLTALSQTGKKAEVKALIQSYGVEGLSLIPADKFAEVLAKAEKL